jgi:hypothetical protein
MKQPMVFVVVVLLLGYQFGSAQQTENSWLIGRWDGNIEGFKGQGGPATIVFGNCFSFTCPNNQAKRYQPSR